jgi:hypothetical protein
MIYDYHKDGLEPEHGEIFVFGSNLAGRQVWRRFRAGRSLVCVADQG